MIADLQGAGLRYNVRFMIGPADPTDNDGIERSISHLVSSALGCTLEDPTRDSSAAGTMYKHRLFKPGVGKIGAVWILKQNGGSQIWLRVQVFKDKGKEQFFESDDILTYRFRSAAHHYV